MKDRIVFFLLGAVLATVAYFAGDMDTADAQSGTKVFDSDVVVKGKLIISGGGIDIYRHPEVVDGFEEIQKLNSFINIGVGTGNACAITMRVGPYDKNKGRYPAKMLMSVIGAGGKYDGTPFSQILLYGNYGGRFGIVRSD